MQLYSGFACTKIKSIQGYGVEYSEITLCIYISDYTNLELAGADDLRGGDQHRGGGENKRICWNWTSKIHLDTLVRYFIIVECHTTLLVVRTPSVENRLEVVWVGTSLLFLPQTRVAEFWFEGYRESPQSHVSKSHVPGLMLQVWQRICSFSGDIYVNGWRVARLQICLLHYIKKAYLNIKTNKTDPHRRSVAWQFAQNRKIFTQKWMIFA